MERVLPSFEVHRPNTTALDQKKSCFLSPGPQGAHLGGGSVSNTRGHVRQPEIGDQPTSGAHPHSYVSSGGCGHPLLRHQPSSHTPSSLLPAHQPGFFQNKVRHSTPSTNSTTTNRRKKTAIPALSPGPWARDRKTAQQTGLLSQQQAQSFNHVALKTGPFTWGRR